MSKTSDMTELHVLVCAFIINICIPRADGHLLCARTNFCSGFNGIIGTLRKLGYEMMIENLSYSYFGIGDNAV